MIIKYGVGFIKPTFFATIRAVIGAGFMLIVLKFRKELKQVFSRVLARKAFEKTNSYVIVTDRFLSAD